MASRIHWLAVVGLTWAGAVGSSTGCSAEGDDQTGDGADVPDRTDRTDDETDPRGSDATEPSELEFDVTFTGAGVECGEEVCQDAIIEGSGFGASGCCADEATSQCGLNMELLGVFLNLRDPGCEALVGQSQLTDECPDSDPIPVFIPEVPDGLILPGCCQTDGQCGYSTDFGGFGFGCIDPGRFGQSSAGNCEP